MKLKEYPVSIFNSILLRYGKKQVASTNCPVIISFTSIPSRLKNLDIVVSSLLTQNPSPQLIVLWLNKTVKEDLPQRLLDLEGEIFEIRYCEGTSSYRKLLPTLKAFPTSTVVTCDDDLIYPRDWLEKLYNAHLEKPDMVISQVGRLISRNKEKELKPYKKWVFIRTNCKDSNFLPVGYGGVLYPVGTFSDEVFNEEVYMSLSPKADDLWFKAMSHLNGKSSYCASEKAKPIPLMKTKANSLGKTNIDKDGNRDQWNALCKHYPKLTLLG